MVIDYDIIAKYSLNSLSCEVRRALKDGWQPFGGVIVIHKEDGYETEFAQVMMMKKEPGCGLNYNSFNPVTSDQF